MSESEKNRGDVNDGLRIMYGVRDGLANLYRYREESTKLEQTKLSDDQLSSKVIFTDLLGVGGQSTESKSRGGMLLSREVAEKKD